MRKTAEQHMCSPEHTKQFLACNKKMEDDSGNMSTKDPMVALLYLLGRDTLSMGVLEQAVSQVESVFQKEADMDFKFTNGWLASYCVNAVERLNTPFQGEKKDKKEVIIEVPTDLGILLIQQFPVNGIVVDVYQKENLEIAIVVDDDTGPVQSANVSFFTEEDAKHYTYDHAFGPFERPYTRPNQQNQFYVGLCNLFFSVRPGGKHKVELLKGAVHVS